jgi:hypothetical protein
VATLLTHLGRAIEPAVTGQDRARFPTPPTEINSITNNRWGGVVGVGAAGRNISIRAVEEID